MLQIQKLRWSLMTLTCMMMLMALVIKPGDAHPATAQPVLTFAVIGDAEPKPNAEFPGLSAAVNTLNALAGPRNIEMVFGVGDLPHKATDIQYRNLTAVLQKLELPFYPIMGNEEFNDTPEKFFEYAQHWGNLQAPVDSIRYVTQRPVATFISASPDLDGREFTDDGVAWIETQLNQAPEQPKFLFVHGAQVGVFPEGGDKGTANPSFQALSEHETLAVIFSGDLHMDLHRVNGIVEHQGVEHVHVPALERTKLPDETFHHPYFRLVTLYDTRLGVIETIDAQTGQTLPKFTHRFDY